MPDISIVIPVYNEEAVIEESYKRLTEVMKGTKLDYELIFVNDGSRDKSFEIMCGMAENDKCVKILNFARNFGHQPAVTAGLDYAHGDAVVMIDADLQDPPEVIPEMIKKWQEGYDVVYGKRLKRAGETVFKKFTASMFYRTLNSLTDVDIPLDTGDFRLMSQKVVEELRKSTEQNRFVRGMISWIGFKQVAVEYNRDARFAGETKYQLKHMMRLAMNGIMGYSYKPLKIISLSSWLCFIISAMVLIYTLISGRFTGFGIASIFFVGGIATLSMSIMSTYITRMLDEVRGRPNYVLQDKINI